MSDKPAAVNEVGVPFNIHGRIRPLASRNGRLIASKGLTLYSCDGDGGGRETIVTAASPIRPLTRLWWVERLLRAGFHGVGFRSATELLAIVRGRILCVDLAARSVVGHVDVERGSRPLNVVTTPTGRSYFGEYFGNGERGPVRIFGSPDGRHWECVHEFPAGAIRHVHGIYFDPFRDGLWVLTGDDGDEAGIWFTDDDFGNLEAVVRGEQRARAVSVIPVADGLIVPMDAPDEPNRIHHFSPGDGSFRELAAIPGSSLASTVDGGCMLISTAVERSRVNTDQRVSVWASIDGATWRCLLRWQRDLAFTRGLRPYLQHPSVYFASGDGRSERVAAFCIGLHGLDGRMISWARSDLESWLRAGGKGA